MRRLFKLLLCWFKHAPKFMTFGDDVEAFQCRRCKRYYIRMVGTRKWEEMEPQFEGVQY